MKFLLSIWIVKFTKFILLLSGRGQGTALPGLIVEKIHPYILDELANQFNKVIVVSGTNGKTTTQTILSEILKSASISFVANSSGSNLKRGIISKLLSEVSFFGAIKKKILLLEVEEATLPKIVLELKPDIFIYTNLFRDQLDAYGELDRTQEFLRNSLKLYQNSSVILNADDPRLAHITNGLKCDSYYYSLGKYKDEFEYEGKLTHSQIAKEVTSISTKEDHSYDFIFDEIKYNLKIPGKFHIYNAVRAIMAAELLDIDTKSIQEGISSTKAAFGRGERIIKDNINYKMLLIKNPAGANVTLDILKQAEDEKLNLVFLLNDKQADGRDVSWIWDTNFEKLDNYNIKNIFCGGSRREDMALRIKYALGQVTKKKDYYQIKKKNINLFLLEDSITLHNLIKSKNIRNVYVLPTYTAMLSFRKYLTGNQIQ